MQHQLPFGAQMTDKLFWLAQKPPLRPMGRVDCLPSLVWAPLSFAVPGKAGWLLCWIPKSHAESDRVFSVDGVSIHISVGVEPLLRDQIFDWDDKKGVVSHDG